MTSKVLEYRGNENYFCEFCQDDKDNFFVMFAPINGVLFENEIETTDAYNGKGTKILANLVTRQDHYIKIPFCNNYFVKYVKNYKEYELINEILDLVYR